jgi:hypothetical protein
MELNQEHHQLVLEKTHATGAEEWYCPTCGRRLLMFWPPEYKKIVLEPGDDYAVHTGAKGGLRMGAPETIQNGDPYAGDKYLIPWIEWMKKVDFEGLWHRDI